MTIDENIGGIQKKLHSYSVLALLAEYGAIVGTAVWDFKLLPCDVHGPRGVRWQWLVV